MRAVNEFSRALRASRGIAVVYISHFLGSRDQRGIADRLTLLRPASAATGPPLPGPAQTIRCPAGRIWPSAVVKASKSAHFGSGARLVANVVGLAAGKAKLIVR